MAKIGLQSLMLSHFPNQLLSAMTATMADVVNAYCYYTAQIAKCPYLAAPLWSVVGLQRPTSATLLVPDSHIRRSGRDLAIPCEQGQASNTQEGDHLESYQ